MTERPAVGLWAMIARRVPWTDSIEPEAKIASAPS